VAAGAIDEQVRALVEQHRPQLEQLVDEAVEAELARLVDERIRARNGHSTDDGTRAPSWERSSSPEARVCNRCQLEKPAAEFEKFRHTCRPCRREQERERAAARRTPTDVEEPPRTEP
jgi:hypothetical protein